MAASAQQRWTPSEISLFEKRIAEKVDLETIAAELGRTVGSVRMRGQIDNVRKCQRRYREDNESLRRHVEVEVQWVVPPTYVRRERDIRLSIPSTSVTQVIFADPVEGYSALASRARKISVQDALEICALYTGARGQVTQLAREYNVSDMTVKRILDGSFFERLLTRRAPGDPT